MPFPCVKPLVIFHALRMKGRHFAGACKSCQDPALASLQPQVLLPVALVARHESWSPFLTRTKLRPVNPIFTLKLTAAHSLTGLFLVISPEVLSSGQCLIDLLTLFVALAAPNHLAYMFIDHLPPECSTGAGYCSALKGSQGAWSKRH